MLDLILNVTWNIFQRKKVQRKSKKSCSALSFIWRWLSDTEQFEFWLTLTENFQNVLNFKNSPTHRLHCLSQRTHQQPVTEVARTEKSSSHHTFANMSELSSRDTENPTKFFLIQFISARTLANLNSRHEELPHAFFSSTHHSPLVVYDGIDLNNKSETE